MQWSYRKTRVADPEKVADPDPEGSIFIIHLSRRTDSDPYSEHKSASRSRRFLYKKKDVKTF